MKFQKLMLVTAVIVIFLGLVMTDGATRSYGVTEWPRDVMHNLSFYRLIGMTRFLGATLVGFGLLIGCGGLHLTTPAAQRAASLVLMIGSAFAGLIALAQQIALWGTPTGWLTVEFCFVLAACFGYLRFVKLGKGPLKARLELGQRAEKLRERWAQQLSEAAAQQERNRLARELHDSIKQQLFSINVSAATVQARWENDTPGARTALEDVRRGAHEAMAEMEALLQHLRPVPLETVGLIEALRKQCEALQYRTGAQVITEFGELPVNERLPLGAQEAIFRIAQESLANIARHARARQVQVRLYIDAEDETLWLKIEDDGHGFNVTNASGGMGLANIRERVEEIGGRLHIESAQGAGTSLVVRVPLASTDGNELKRLLYRSAVCSVASGLLVACGKRLLLTLFTYRIGDQAFWFIFPHLAIPVLAGLAAAIAFYVRARLKIRELESSKTISKKNLLRWRRVSHQVSLLIYGNLFWWADFSRQVWRWWGDFWKYLWGNWDAMFFPALMIILYCFHLRKALQEEDEALSREESKQVSDQLWHQATKLLGPTLIALLLLAWWQPTIQILAIALAVIAYVGFIAWWRRQVKARTLDALGGIR